MPRSSDDVPVAKKMTCYGDVVNGTLAKHGGRFYTCDTVARFGPKVGQIGPKCDKSNNFSDNISKHFVSPSEMF